MLPGGAGVTLELKFLAVSDRSGPVHTAQAALGVHRAAGNPDFHKGFHC